MHLWEKLFINSKLFTLQKNLTRVHLWGTFASHWHRVARVGYCGLSIKINAGIWLVGDTDTHWQWGVHWMETQFLAIFLLFKKGTATPIFNNSPALYRNICSIRKLPRATTNVQKNKSYVGLFISYVGLFMSYVGLIKSYIGLYNSYVGDKIS